MPAHRKPTQVKLLEGTFRADRANAAEPRPPSCKVRMPTWLKGRARWAWEQLSEVLGPDGMKVLTKADRYGLALLVDAYAEYRAVRDLVAAEGEVYTTTTDKGDVMRRAHPAVAIAADAWRRTRLLLLDFGLVPAARSRVSAQAAGEVDPLEEMLRRKRERRAER